MTASHLAALLIIGMAAEGSGQAVRFAVIGDYGVDNANELAVANLVKGRLLPEFIVTTGDNQYDGAAATDRDIGKYYHEFIGDYRGTYGTGAVSNRFFPALGNHDFVTPGGYSNHLHYFTLPGNERYYDFQRGPVQICVVNSELNEPDGTSSSSVQARWLSNRLAAVQAPWKLVVDHDPPYSSTSHAATRMRWPFERWGACAVISGSAHHYERFNVNGLAYFVNGAGGAGLAGFESVALNSVIRYGAQHGAMLITADPVQITFEFFSVQNGGTLIDRWQLVQPRLESRLLTNTLILSWATNLSQQFRLEESARLPATLWRTSDLPVQVTGTQRTVRLPLTRTNRFFRLSRP